MEETTNQNNDIYNAQYDPSSLYNDMLQEVLKGLLNAINLHHGKLEKVKREDVLEEIDINPSTFDRYYKSTDDIISEVHEQIKSIIGLTVDNMDRFRSDAVVRILLENLSKQPLMLRILIALDDRSLWEKHLQVLIWFVATKWHSISDRWIGDIFEVFCFQFHHVLIYWEQYEFDEDHLESCVDRIMAWLEADAEYVYFATTPRPDDLV